MSDFCLGAITRLIFSKKMLNKVKRNICLGISIFNDDFILQKKEKSEEEEEEKKYIIWIQSQLHKIHALNKNLKSWALILPKRIDTLMVRNQLNELLINSALVQNSRQSCSKRMVGVMVSIKSNSCSKSFCHFSKPFFPRTISRIPNRIFWITICLCIPPKPRLVSFRAVLQVFLKKKNEKKKEEEIKPQ